ncbi:hypothetical protein [Xenorhabdus bovienii]|uniref:hypothetical protein n=2 Tax=Xenorhabdus bovienii TaxID=40576 RepID=UPI00237CAFF1|nr:hypothetical protein [Xenorhabdus bovienii]MDE1483031.1 hypothetical protein [Xenorhabdus bovienii]MDE1496367.1 hypothetical protein [Xenorhabdus bovienii]MDE9436809.1 hypothetical protein [Xenorhabdus bovienii]MDE9442738.1 hypothetical protein [Xenorhabdus bovienii]MDE9459480.1 hypothetical protein [Xenorhabdus bovienii]
MEKITERLMIDYGFTLNEINRIKSAAKRSGNDIKKEILILSNGFYGLVLGLLVILFSLLSVVVFVNDVDYLSVILTVFISLFFALFFSSPKLKYKSFMFLKKHKG